MVIKKGCIILKSKGFNAYTKHMILKHALKGGNISKTCELFGISRTTFYNWQKAYQKDGVAGLEKKKRQKPQMPNKVSKEIENEILAYVAKFPKDGPRRIFYELKAEGFDVGETGIYNVLKRNKLTKAEQRIKYANAKPHYRKTKRKNNKKYLQLLNSNNTYPGYVVIQKIDFIGTFDNIGRIYQYSFYDTISKWGEVKIYNRKQDIDIWHYFERKLIYLLETFNLNIENLITKKDREFLPYFVKDNKYEEILKEFHINHIFISAENNDILDEIRKFNELLVKEFYNKIPMNQNINSFIKVENAINNFIREYNFCNKIANGPNKGKTPAEVVLERSIENGTNLDTLPLWLLALINSPKRGDNSEK